MLRFLWFIFYILATIQADDPQQHADLTIKVFENASSKCILARSANLTTLSNGKRYSFHPTRVEWKVANETCTSQGLHLVTLRDQDEAKVVTAEAQRIKPEYGWWVSAKNQGISGGRKDFRWHDGTELDLDSPLWYENADKRDDCVYTHGSSANVYSYRCTGPTNFICQLPNECY